MLTLFQSARSDQALLHNSYVMMSENTFLSLLPELETKREEAKIGTMLSQRGAAVREYWELTGTTKWKMELLKM